MIVKNVDQHELNTFDSMAPDWWNPQGPCKPLHLLNPVRLSYLLSQTRLTGKEVLDVGCGGGLLSEAMSKAGAKVTGLELAPQVLDIARHHACDAGLEIDYQNTLVEDYAQMHPGRFDVITCMEMLEHVPDPASIVQACHRLLKPGGLILLSTLNRHPMAFIQAIIGAEYLLNLLPKGTHHYRQFIKPSELDVLLGERGFSFKHIQGVSYYPLREYFCLTPSVSVNYMVTYQAVA